MGYFLDIPDKVENGLLIIQGTGFCNLNCRYCYVPDRKNKDKMPLELFEVIIRKVFSSQIYHKRLDLVWHAGEPLVLGVSYYAEALHIIKKYCPPEIKLRLHIQTNAVLMTQEWADFFKENNFIIGVSIDGPKFLHDDQRVGWNQKGSFDRTLAGLKLIQKNKVSYSIICVLTANSLNYPDEIYNFFRDHGVKSLCFNVEEKEGDNFISSIVSNNAVETAFSAFMSRIYDLWEADNRQISIREIDGAHRNIRGLLLSEHPKPDPQESIPFKILTFTQTGDVVMFSPELAGGTKDNRREFVIANIREIDDLRELIHQLTFRTL